MRFVKEDLDLVLERRKYLIYQKNVSPTDFAGTNAMEIDYNYTEPEGCGSGSGEYLRMDEIHQMCVGLCEVTDHVRNSYSIEFDYTFYRTRAFIKLSLEWQEDRLRFRMCLNNLFGDEQVDQLFEKEEWMPYLKEFLTWDEPLSFQLGDSARTLVDAGCSFEADKKGTIMELYPPDERSVQWEATVDFLNSGYNGLFRNGRLYNVDEIEPNDERKR